MTLKNRLLMTAGALTLAAVGITGVMAAHPGDAGKACPKSGCAKECPSGHPCPDCSHCPGC